MKKRSQTPKKMLITLSSGVLLSLVNNAYTVSAETQNTEGHVDIYKESHYIVDAVSIHTMDGEEISEEASILMDGFRIALAEDNQLVFYGQVTPESNVIIQLSEESEVIGTSDENGYFEIQLPEEIFEAKFDSALNLKIQDASGEEQTFQLIISMDQMQEMTPAQTEPSEDEVENEESVETEETAQLEMEAEQTNSQSESEGETTSEEVEKVEEPIDNQVENEIEESSADQSTEENTDEKEASQEELTTEEPKEEVAEEQVIEEEPEEDMPTAAPEETDPKEAVEKEVVETTEPIEEAVESDQHEEEAQKTDETPKEAPVEEKSAPKEPATLSTFRTFAATTASVPSNGVYTVQSGDSLSRIANKFGLSMTQLLEWNPQITNANLIKVGQKINVTKAAYERSKEEEKEHNQASGRPFATNQEFLEFIASYAMEIANLPGKPKLYASVMIAQAAHESAFGRSLLSLPPYYNLFGIKGSYNGASVPMGTWEEEGGNVVNITAKFRDYPSYYESMLDYANLLRDGLSWNRNFYAPTWAENTDSYKDATAYLTGTYATDSRYNIKVNNIIEQYNLTQYDTHLVNENIKGAVNVSYSALIASSGFTIDTKPWGTSGFQPVDKTNNYIGARVEVTKESSDRNYALIEYDGRAIGWVDKKALSDFQVNIQDVSSSVKVSYKAVIGSSGYSIDSLPWETAGYQRVASSTDFVGKEVDVVKETSNGNYLLVALDGELLGWIDHKAVQDYSVVADVAGSKVVSYYGTIDQTGFSLDTRPWGTSGYRTIGKTNDYLGRQVKVVRESSSGNYALVEYDGKLLGWVDKKAVGVDDVVVTIPNSQPVLYNATIAHNGYSIDTKPWGTEGYRTITTSTSYKGLAVQVIRETNNGNYVLISANGRELGWVDKKALSTPRVESNVSNAKSVSYSAVVSRTGFSLDTKPWGESGFATIGKTNDLTGLIVDVVKEDKGGNYALVQTNGQNLGWVDKRALTKFEVTANVSRSTDVSYNATISSTGFSIDTKPWGYLGFKTITKTNNYLGTQVKIVRETNNGNYALIELDGTLLGWVDKKGLAR